MEATQEQMERYWISLFHNVEKCMNRIAAGDLGLTIGPKPQMNCPVRTIITNFYSGNFLVTSDHREIGAIYARLAASFDMPDMSCETNYRIIRRLRRSEVLALDEYDDFPKGWKHCYEIHAD